MAKFYVRRMNVLLLIMRSEAAAAAAAIYSLLLGAACFALIKAKSLHRFSHFLASFLQRKVSATGDAALPHLTRRRQQQETTTRKMPRKLTTLQCHCQCLAACHFPPSSSLLPRLAVLIICDKFADNFTTIIFI